MKKEKKAVLMDVIGVLQGLADNSKPEQGVSVDNNEQNDSITEEHVEFVKLLKKDNPLCIKGFVVCEDGLHNVSIGYPVFQAMLNTFLKKYDK